MNPHNQLLPTKEVLKRLCICKTLLYGWIKQGLMTPSIPLTQKSVVWPEHEVQAIIDSIVARHSKETRQALVLALMAKRTESVAQTEQMVNSRCKH